MPDIFRLFDGRVIGDRSSTVEAQDGSSFSTVVSENDLVASLATGSDEIDLRVDYSDFANFVTFNSAESYVTITADKILNEYPIGGTVNDVQEFTNSMDGYQRYFLGLWPSRTGHLRLNPAVASSYVRVDDFGVIDGVARTSLMSPGTSSLSAQGWLDVPVLTGSSDVLVVLQKLASNGQDGYSVYLSGSSLFFSVSSGSSSSTVSGALGTMPAFFSAVLDRTSTTGTLSLYLGTTGSFPELSDSRSIVVGRRFDLGSGSMYIGSGSIASKVVRPFTGSLDDVSLWTVPRTTAALTSSYNVKLYAQSGLVGAWRFNEATPSTPSSYAGIARDSSGHRLDGRIVSYSAQLRGSGSLANDVPDPILSLDDPDVVTYVITAQTSGSLYDRDNPSLIFRLFPEYGYLRQDDPSVRVFQAFTLTLARMFDRAKLYISQLPNLRRVTYDDFDDVPDDLLADAGRYLGWDLDGTFASMDAMRYLVSRDVSVGPQGNAPLDVTVTEIRAQLWRRVLQNLPYIYRTKGTEESVGALLRSLGLDGSFVRLKEFARRTEARVPTGRVTAEKSVYALRFSSGSTVRMLGA